MTDTIKEGSADEADPSARKPREFCRNGHPWVDPYVNTRGIEECRACRKDAMARSRARKAAREGRVIKPRPRHTDTDGVPLCLAGRHRMEGDNVYERPDGYKQCRPCDLTNKAARYAANRDQELVRLTARNAAIKLVTLAAYSPDGLIACVCCGETDLRVLGLDHLKSDGAEHRRKLKGPGGGHTFYRTLQLAGYPQDLSLAVSCRCCDQGRATVSTKVCPDVADPPEPANGAQRYTRKLKRDVMELLGGACERCGLFEPIQFLSLEHRNGGGTQHYRELGNGDVGSGRYRLYQMLRRGEEPPDAYGVLCHNDQTIAEIERREQGR